MTEVRPINLELRHVEQLVSFQCYATEAIFKRVFTDGVGDLWMQFERNGRNLLALNLSLRNQIDLIYYLNSFRR